MDKVKFLHTLDSFLSCQHRGLEIDALFSSLAQFLFQFPFPVCSRRGILLAFTCLKASSQDFLQISWLCFFPLSRMHIHGGFSVNNGRKWKLLLTTLRSCFIPRTNFLLSIKARALPRLVILL